MEYLLPSGRGHLSLLGPSQPPATLSQPLPHPHFLNHTNGLPGVNSSAFGLPAPSPNSDNPPEVKSLIRPHFMSSALESLVCQWHHWFSRHSQAKILAVILHVCFSSVLNSATKPVPSASKIHAQYPSSPP